MKSYWIKVCPVLIDLVTDSKCTAVLNQKRLHLLLKDQYVVSTGPRECVLIDCSCLGTTALYPLWCCLVSSIERQAVKQKFNKFFFFFAIGAD